MTVYLEFRSAHFGDTISVHKVALRGLTRVTANRHGGPALDRVTCRGCRRDLGTSAQGASIACLRCSWNPGPKMADIPEDSGTFSLDPDIDNLAWVRRAIGYRGLWEYRC